MANVGQALKAEISRVSGKVVRQHIGPIKTSANALQHQLVVLKKQVQLLTRELSALKRATERGGPLPEATGEVKFRFTAKGLISLRKRLGVSAEDFGHLIEASAQTIYNWEREKTTPRAAQLPAIAGLRKLGKREVGRRLQDLTKG